MTSASPPTVPLREIQQGAQATFVKAHAGQGLRTRLAAMGLVPGTIIQVIRNGNRGPFIVSIKGSRVVLGRGVAERIYVTTNGTPIPES